MSFIKRAAPGGVALLVSGLLALAVAAGNATPAKADVDDFFFEKMNVGISLGQWSPDGPGTIEVKEHFVAHFPDYNQNRGIVRYLPDWYNDYPLETELIEASGSDKRTVVEEFREGDAYVVQMAVPEGEYVTGIKNYDIHYTQNNVISLVNPSNPNGDQEFYWDINGTGWAQSFKEVTANISLDPALWDAALVHTFSCYQGRFGETTPCEIEPMSLGYGVGFTVRATDLAAGETITVALAFKPNTFDIPTRDYWASIFPWLQLTSLALALIFSGFALWLRLLWLRSAPGRPTIITEYQPPKGLELSTAAGVLQKLPALPSAMLLQLAVSGKAKLVQVKKKEWALEVLDADFTPAETEFFRVLFGSAPNPGQSYDLGKPSSRRIKRLSGYSEQVKRELRQLGLVVQPRMGQRIVIGVAGALLGATSFGFSLLALNARFENAVVVSLLVSGLLVAVLPPILMSARPLTAAGAEIRDALKGLKVYIELAEKDRLEFLQSPKGAERQFTERGEILKLYEKLLPWATLLGLGKEWSRTLEQYYEDQTPVWIAGAYGVSFHDSYSAFTAGANNSFSSSDGGSSGGGSAGGGGGGGGGGGI